MRTVKSSYYYSTEPWNGHFTAVFFKLQVRLLTAIGSYLLLVGTYSPILPLGLYVVLVGSYNDDHSYIYLLNKYEPISLWQMYMNL